MAVTKSQTVVNWGGTTGDTVASGGNLTSDAKSISDAAIDATVTLKGDNVGTPTSGDTFDVKILYSNGDLPGLPDGSDEFDSPEHAVSHRFDTNAGDPVVATIQINTSAKAFKIHVENNGASGVAMSANYGEQVVS